MPKKKQKKSKGCKYCSDQEMAGGRQAQSSGLLASILPSGRSEQFLLGAAIGAVAAYVLSDEALRGKLMKAGLRLYGEMAGGLEEMKEQVADLKAELAAERSGTV